MSKHMRWDKLFTYDTLAHAVAGACGSTVAMSVFFPLDTVRSRLQVEDSRESKSTLAVLRELVAEEGFLTLYRGLEPVLVSLWCSNFVYFYSFHGLRAIFAQEQHSAYRDLFLGCVAGVCNVLLTTPMWVVNTRMKMQGAKVDESLRKHPRYKGIMHGLLKIYMQEGPKALWASTLPSLMLVSNPAIQFMLYESLKRRAAEANKTLDSYTIFLIGAISKCTAALATYPLQVVQSKMRYSNDRRGIVGILTDIMKQHGPLGIYRGLESKLLQTVLTAALMLVAYEKIVTFVLSILKAAPKQAAH